MEKYNDAILVSILFMIAYSFIHFFVMWDFDMSRWSMGSRFVFASLNVTVGGLVFTIFYTKEKSADENC